MPTEKIYIKNGQYQQSDPLPRYQTSVVARLHFDSCSQKNF